MPDPALLTFPTARFSEDHHGNPIRLALLRGMELVPEQIGMSREQKLGRGR
jgi:hypothetical protein